MALTARTVLTNATKVVGMLLPIGVGLGLGKLATPYLPQLTVWVEGLGAWAPIAFIVAYIGASVFMLPAFLLIIAAGAIFGMARGSLYVFIGASLGACTAFLLGRTILRRWVAAQIAKNDTLTVVDRVIGQEGLKLMFLLRLSGVVPFVLTNYAMGVSAVSLRDFAIALIGMAPTIVTYTMIGQAGVQNPEDGSIPRWVLFMGIGATVLLAVMLTRIAQRAIKEADARHQMQALTNAPGASGPN
ncbi:MAG: TVP38/TMEM64 family protein [Gemmatimonadaceae bacterium]|nr:TVP38/TMEM64 family protein [Gemmatimonadaceae bacterium]